MNEENNNLENMNEEEFDELENIVVLTDEEGNDVEFEFLDVVQLEDKEYGEVVIFRIEGEGEEESYIGLEDENEAEAVFKAFKEKAKDDFNFAD